MMLTRHFSKEEMACPCCGLCEMNPKFMNELEDYRQMVGYPITVISGMRCEAHNAAIPYAAKKSWHLVGKAADLKWTKDKFMMLRIALACFDGVGISQDFLHVDLGKVRRCWIY